MYGPLLYYGPITAGDVRCSSNAAEVTTNQREDKVSTRIAIDHKGTALQWEIEDEEMADRVVSAVVKVLNPAEPETRTRRKFTPEQLKEIADAWHAAPEGQRNKAVRDLLGVNRQNATNYIHRCRAVGLIAPPASRPRTFSTSTATVAPVNSFAEEIEQILASHQAEG